MDVVIDTSAVIAVITNEPERPLILQLTGEKRLVAPASLHWEVGNAFSAMFRRHRINLAEAIEALRRYELLTFEFIDIELDQSVTLSDRLNLYAYDAYFVVCALKLQLPLLTLDRRLALAADTIGVQVMEVDT